METSRARSQCAKKGQMVAKLVRELMVAAKLGGPDPDGNPRLAAQIAWRSIAGNNYQVQVADVLNSNLWFDLGPSISGNGTTLSEPTSKGFIG